MALIQRKDRTDILRSRPVMFSDFDLNLEKTQVGGDLTKNINELSVKSSIRNIILTDRTERFFNAEFGCSIRQMLFENIEPSTEVAIQSLITTAIENFEPRAQLIGVVASGQVDLNAYTVTVIFNTINNVERETLELILTRVR